MRRGFTYQLLFPGCLGHTSDHFGSHRGVLLICHHVNREKLAGFVAEAIVLSRLLIELLRIAADHALVDQGSDTVFRR